MRVRHALIAVTTALLVLLAGISPAQSADGDEAGGPTTPPPASAHGVVPNQYIVSVKTSSNVDEVLRWYERYAGAEALFMYRETLNGFAIRIPDAWADDIARDQRVASVVQDRLVSTMAQRVPTGVARVGGALSSTVAGNGSGAVDVDIAIIDTGIASRAELNVVGGKACNGSSFNDSNGHGTHVAGTAAAADDDRGVVGIAPGARLWAVKVLGSNGSGSTSQVICGINWVAANAATIEVANMSLGGSGSEGNCDDGGEHQAICRAVAAGVTFVVAAGNDSRNAASFVPAAYDEVITVSALADFDGTAGGGAASTCRSDVDDTFANFSNFGPDIDLIAPGVCIRSTWTSGTKTLSGTSMASPHVAGAAALYKSRNPSATPAQVKAALIAVGSAAWSNSDDGDAVKEPLLAASTL